MPKLEQIPLIEGSEQEFKSPNVDDVGETFISWAEKYWGMEKAFTKPEKEGEESAPWSAIRPIFVREINELVENHKTGGIEPGYYQISKGCNPV